MYLPQVSVSCHKFFLDTAARKRSPILTTSLAVPGAYSFRLALSMADDARDAVASNLLNPMAAVLCETFFFGAAAVL